MTKCACPTDSAVRCVEVRYGRDFDHTTEDPCDCVCHDEWYAQQAAAADECEESI